MSRYLRIVYTLLTLLSGTHAYAQSLPPVYVEVPATVRLITDQNRFATISFWSDDEKPQKLLEFSMTWNRPGNRSMSFEGAIATRTSLELRALGSWERTGTFNGVHFHEMKLVNLPRAGKWRPALRVAGQVGLLFNRISPDTKTPSVFHAEPGSARIDFTLPLRKKRNSLMLGAEAGPWIDSYGDQLEIAPGTRATIRLRVSQ